MWSMINVWEKKLFSPTAPYKHITDSFVPSRTFLGVNGFPQKFTEVEAPK